MPKRSGVGSTSRPLKDDAANVLARSRQALARDLRAALRMSAFDREDVARALRCDLNRVAGIVSGALAPRADEFVAIRALIDGA